MPRAYSKDLRRRIVEAYLAGEGTRAQIAKRFQVSPASVDRYIRQFRTSGSVEPARRVGGGPERRVRPEDAPLFAAWLAENPSLTQTELAERYERETGRAVSQRTISRVLGRLGITRKKRHSTPRNAIEPM